MFSREKKLKWRLSKWWENLQFWMNYPFNKTKPKVIVSYCFRSFFVMTFWHLEGGTLVLIILLTLPVEDSLTVKNPALVQASFCASLNYGWNLCKDPVSPQLDGSRSVSSGGSFWGLHFQPLCVTFLSQSALVFYAHSHLISSSVYSGQTSIIFHSSAGLGWAAGILGYLRCLTNNNQTRA